jgi:hypothetical protein
MAAIDGANQNFETTDDHPWWVPGHGWKRTDELIAGMSVSTADGRGVRVVNVENTRDIQPTFNLTVADFHTYFVGEQQVWVHNANCDPRTSASPLRRNKDGVAKPDPEAKGREHTQLGEREGSNGEGRYRQGREFDADGNPVQDTDFTNHNRPNEHSDPHVHKFEKVSGSDQRQPAQSPNPYGASRFDDK